MKRIEFISPVEAMRGNLSGKQNLVYAENDNKAYEAPVGRQNYARNYQPRFIGAKVAKSGKKYFTVKTKACTNLTTKAKMHMAVFGGAAAIVGAIMNNVAYKTLMEHLRDVNYEYATRVAGFQGTFRQYLTTKIQGMLSTQVSSVTFKSLLSQNDRTINNPWVQGGEGQNIEIADGVIVKFWDELSENGTHIFVEGQKGLAYLNVELSTIIGTNKNVLGLSLKEVASKNYIAMGDQYLLNASNEYVEDTYIIETSNEVFTLTEEDPV